VDIIPNTLVGMMAAKYSPHVYAYALNFSKRRDPEMEKVYQESLDIDLAILGAGALEDVSPGFSQLLERCGLSTERLLQSGAVGEFNSQLITAEGEEFRYPKHIQSLTSRLRTVPLKQLRKLSMHGQKRVIAICGGVAKKNVVQSVLAGRYCNTLITDEELATALLSTKGG
jgi:DNA-binding transcriptional regulator LsrR (DeoR family)